MATEFMPDVRAIIDRCAGRDRHDPPHDRARAEAAYRRRLAVTGCKRRIRWLADPIEVWEWAIAADRSARAMRIAALLAAFPHRTQGAQAGLEQVLAPRGWSAAGDLAAIGHPPLAPAAVEAWQAAQGWLDTAVIGCGPHWDAGCTMSTNLWSSLLERAADGIAANPALSWLAGPTIPHPILPSFPTTPLQAWAGLARGFAPAAWSVWHGATGLDVGLGLGLLAEPRRSAAADVLLGAYEPMIEAFEAGAFGHSLLEDALLVLAAPAIWTDGHRLHRADGPAVAWPVTKVYAWKGVVVPERVIMDKESITPGTIQAEANQEIRRAMIDIFGIGRYRHETDAVVVHEDETGRLWSLRSHRGAATLPDDVMAVEVENGTAEPDGSRKTYWLSVPPDMTTAKEAVSWSYALTPEQYERLAVRT